MKNLLITIFLLIIILFTIYLGINVFNPNLLNTPYIDIPTIPPMYVEYIKYGWATPLFISGAISTFYRRTNINVSNKIYNIEINEGNNILFKENFKNCTINVGKSPDNDIVLQYKFFPEKLFKIVFEEEPTIELVSEKIPCHINRQKMFKNIKYKISSKDIIQIGKVKIYINTLQ